jgi:hypothetical protein
MIAARTIPAVKPERPGVLAVAPVPTYMEEGGSLRLADALAALAGQRFYTDEISLSTSATLGPRGATFTQAPHGASGGAGGSQP